MGVYVRAFMNCEEDDWSKLLSIAEFTYNNMKNTSINHIIFESNCGYRFRAFYEKNVNPHSQLKSADEMNMELQELIVVCKK